jgi:hypothetical protein
MQDGRPSPPAGGAGKLAGCSLQGKLAPWPRVALAGATVAGAVAQLLWLSSPARPGLGGGAGREPARRTLRGRAVTALCARRAVLDEQGRRRCGSRPSWRPTGRGSWSTSPARAISQSPHFPAPFWARLRNDHAVRNLQTAR